MPTLRLRPTTEQDLDFVMAAESAPECQGLVGQSSRAEHLRFASDPGRSHRIIEHASVPAGFAITYNLVPVDCGVYLKRIVIAEKGRGLGRQAISALLEHAASELRAPYLWLGVFHGNARAVRCYESCGLSLFQESSAEIERHKAHADGAHLDGCLLYRVRFGAPPTSTA